MSHATRCLLISCCCVPCWNGAAVAGWFISVQPIQVRSDDGLIAANPDRELYLDETSKIFDQIGVDVEFDPWTTFDETAFLETSSGEFFDLVFGTGHGQSADPLTLNMYFVQDIPNVFGLGVAGGNGVAISDAVFDFNGGIGRLDTIAHEIGHNLGLPHGGGPDHLMESGGSRLIPTSINDIVPDGLGLDKINVAQTSTIFQSPFLQFFADGDFDADGDYSCADIDALTAAIATDQHDLTFDLNGDTLVNQSDLQAWLVEAGREEPANTNGNPYLVGDANLDGLVDGSDFVIWNTSKFTSNSAWCSGDLNADGVVDGADFLQWNDNKFTSAADLTAVPEPSCVRLLLLCGIVLVCRRHRSRSAPDRPTALVAHQP
ncbi:MAG: zinc-dependent metalloprotease family protein [Planctomycetota bacterium]